MNRRVETVPDDTMKYLPEYEWPGNVRELQNFIERSVILSPGTILLAPVESLRLSERTVRPEPKTLAQAELEHILNAIKETGWVIGGPNGAARKLGLKRTTLVAK
jgi:DNA-binding NtrC family response regulator